MKNSIAIMQPYFLPYLGYWQLINTVEKFVIYDHVQYTKRGWINRNQWYVNGQVKSFSLPLKKASSEVEISSRFLVDNFSDHADKLIRQATNTYKRSPFFEQGMEILVSCLKNSDRNLFNFVHNSILVVLEFLDIHTQIVISSNLDYDESTRGEDRVIAICNELDAKYYINPVSGKHLYSPARFRENLIQLAYLQPVLRPYRQVGTTFNNGLSIIDIAFCCDRLTIMDMLNDYNVS